MTTSARALASPLPGRPARRQRIRIFAAAFWILVTALGFLAIHQRLSFAGEIQFVEASTQGIDFRHVDGGSGRKYLIEAVSAGLATFDYDSDGDLDVFFLNGAPLKGASYDKPPQNALYRNDGNWKFTDVTQQAGVGDRGFGLGIAVADFNNDGFPDMYLNNYGANVLYQNNGDGSFSDVTRIATAENGQKVGAGASFLDIDADGDLDLYAANYIKFSYDMKYPNTFRGSPAYPGPVVFPAESDDLFRNNGDGTFVNISAAAGIAEHAEWGMGTVAADFDNDGDTDIFVANDSTRNLLFFNDGQGRFSESGLLAGVAFDLNGHALGSMGVDCGDYNNDGRLDLYLTSYQKQLAVLYENLGAGLFEDATRRTQAGAGTYHHVNWGTGLIDFDNDGFRDLFVANGHIHDDLERFDDTTSYEVANQVLRNIGGELFQDVSATAGPGLEPRLSSRGTAFDDLDGDGDVDVVILNSRKTPTLLENVSPPDQHWISIWLHGVRSNRDAVGSKVTISAGLTQHAEVVSGRSYQSHYGTRLHFGLGTSTRVDRLQVQWHAGKTVSFRDLDVDQVIHVVEFAREVRCEQKAQLEQAGQLPSLSTRRNRR